MNLKIDIHIHSTNSFDSSIQIRDLPEILRSKGLDGIAITDHDKFFDEEVEGLIVIPGIEVSTREGHLLGFCRLLVIKSAFQKLRFISLNQKFIVFGFR